MKKREQPQMPFWRMFIFIFVVITALLGLGLWISFLIWHAWTGGDMDRLCLLAVHLALALLLSSVASGLIYRAELRRIHERRSSGQSDNETPPT